MTLTVGAVAIVLAVCAGVLVGTLAALRQYSVAGDLPMGVAAAGIAIPSFVVLPFLALYFGFYLKWLPVAGWEPDSGRYYVLPIIALTLPPMAYIARLARASVIDVMTGARQRSEAIHEMLVRVGLDSLAASRFRTNSAVDNAGVSVFRAR